MTESRPDLRKAYDVVVVGAGIAGLALTRELHRKGISCVALERRPAIVDAELAINLPWNAVAALRSLGQDKDLGSYWAPVDDANTHVLAQHTFPDTRADQL